MKRKSITVSLPDPCNKDWNKMSPAANGRHCDSCNKCVIDFTDMSDEEMYAILKNSKNKICGRFTDEQLDREIVVYEKDKFPYLKIAAMAAGIAILGTHAGVSAQGRIVYDTITVYKNGADTLQLASNSQANTNVYTYVIKGNVRDKRGRPIEDARVRLNENASVILETRTDKNGSYSIETELRQGQGYAIRASRFGFALNERVLYCGDKEKQV